MAGNESARRPAATTPRRVLIAGSRSWQDINAIRMRMSKLPPEAVIVHGGAPGADRTAGFLADDFGFTFEEHPAEWEKHGKRAGFLRNVEMLESGIDLVLAFWDGASRGTKHTIDEARKRGIPVEVVTSTPETSGKPENAGGYATQHEKNMHILGLGYQSGERAGVVNSGTAPANAARWGLP